MSIWNGVNKGYSPRSCAPGRMSRTTFIPSPSPRVDEVSQVAPFDRTLDRMNQSDSDYLRWKGWSDERFGELTGRQRRYYDWHVKRALGGAPCDRVLEVGFGNGTFLHYCRNRRWHIVGI